jgi:hypothetical protein
MKRLSVFAIAVVSALSLVVGSVLRAHADSEFAVAQPTFYIVAPGGDAGIAPIVQSVAERFQALFDATNKSNPVWVIPRSGWSPDDLFNQCANDPTKGSPGGPKILGGLILDGTNTYTSQSNSYLVWVRGWSKITSHAQLVFCKPLGAATPTITWVADDVNGYAAKNGFPIEVGTAAGLYLGSAHNSTASDVALGASISALDSTAAVPPVDPADESREAAKRVANDLISKITLSCANKDSTIATLCARLGLAPGVPLATPAPPH